MNFDFHMKPGQYESNKYTNISNEPLLSIVTAYYNAGEHFYETYCAVVNQTFPYFEWLIVNDGSTKPDDVTLLQELSDRDKRIRVLHKENGGISTARNVGIRNATTDYIFILDADDLIEKNQLEILYFALHTNPSASWAYSGLVAFGGAEYLWDIPFNSTREKTENILIVSSLIKKSALEEVNYYDESLKHYNEDWYLWLRLLAKGHFPVHVQTYGFWYRVNTTGVASIVKGNEAARMENEKLINGIRGYVPDNISAITFGKQRADFVNTVHWTWDRSLPYREKKTHILLLIPHMEMGGADMFNLDLIKRIDKSRFEITIITTQPDENEMIQKFSTWVDEIFELPKFLHMQEWPSFIYYLIQSRSIRVILNLSSYMGYYLLPWLKSEFSDIRTLDYIHADSEYWRNGGYARASAGLQDFIDKTVVANEATKNTLVTRYGKNKEQCVVSYIGTDVQYFDPDILYENNIRKQYEIPENAHVILYICRLSQEKRPLLMLEVVRRLCEKLTDIYVLVVGSGPAGEKTRERIHSYNLDRHVILTGEQADVRPYYQAADVLLITSIKEGLTLTTFEAFAMRKPVVSADVGGQSEAVTADVGFLVPCLQDAKLDFENDTYLPEEVEGYIEPLYTILTDEKLRLQMGERARQKVENQFNINNSIHFIEAIITELLEDESLTVKKTYPSLMKELVTLYMSFESKQIEAEEVWGGREWFRELYERALQKNQNIQSQTAHETQYLPIAAGDSEAQRRLAEIYQMRSWNLILKYRRFMDSTRFGRVLCKIRDAFRIRSPR